MAVVPVRHRSFFFPVVLLFIRNLDSRSAGSGLPRFAKIIRPKRKLPAASASAGGFSPAASEHAGKCECTRRFFPVQGKNLESLRQNLRIPFAVGFRLGPRRRNARENALYAGCSFFSLCAKHDRQALGQDHGGRRGFPDRRRRPIWRAARTSKIPPAIAGTGAAGGPPENTHAPLNIGPALEDSKRPIAGGREKA